MYTEKITPGGGRAGTDDPGSIGMGEWVVVFSLSPKIALVLEGLGSSSTYRLFSPSWI